MAPQLQQQSQMYAPNQFPPQAGPPVAFNYQQPYQPGKKIAYFKVRNNRQ